MKEYDNKELIMDDIDILVEEAYKLGYQKGMKAGVEYCTKILHEAFPLLDENK